MTVKWSLETTIGNNSIQDAVDKAIEIAQAADDAVEFFFNGTLVSVAPTHRGQVVSRYWKDRRDSNDGKI